MSKYVAVLLVILASAGAAYAETQTVTGEVISLSCYFNSPKNIGRAGAVCALATVRWEANPVGILTSDGKVFQLAGKIVDRNNADIAPMLGHTVTVTGETSEKQGMPMLTAERATPVK